MSGIVSHSVMIFLCYFKWSEHSEIVQIIAFLFVLSVFTLQGRVGKIDKNNRILLNMKLSLLLLSPRTDSKGVSLQTEHFHILEMSKCPGTSSNRYISTKVGHYSTLCLAPGSRKQLNDVTLPIFPPAVAQSIVARETSD